MRFWGCRACKAARDEAAKEAREARRRNGEGRDWDDWTQEDREPPQALHRRRWQQKQNNLSLAHVLSGSCAGNKEEARYFMRKLDKHTARATARVELRQPPESKDTASRFGALPEEEYLLGWVFGIVGLALPSILMTSCGL